MVEEVLLDGAYEVVETLGVTCPGVMRMTQGLAG
jgi:hypothetical protein